MHKAYKFRAECISDVWKFLDQTPRENISQFSITPLLFPDVEVEITTQTDLKALCKTLRGIEDGHVMQETIQLKELYTGERLQSRE